MTFLRLPLELRLGRFQRHNGNIRRDYLLNQVLYTRLLICAEVLSKYKSASLVFLFVTLLPLVSLWSFGSSTISNQLVAGSIIVRHIKSILEPSLPLRVYKPMRSTHNASQGVVMTSFYGTCPHFCCVSYWPGKICKIWHIWFGTQRLHDFIWKNVSSCFIIQTRLNSIKHT